MPLVADGLVVSPLGGSVPPTPPAMLFGPSAATRRDLGVPLRWAGLSRDDHAILGDFLASFLVPPDELHTNVPVGGTVVCPPGMCFEASSAMADALYPRKIDAAVRFGPAWWLIECKPTGRVHALGQLLAYYYWWVRDCPTCTVHRLVLLCRECGEDEHQVYAASGVDVVMVPFR